MLTAFLYQLDDQHLRTYSFSLYRKYAPGCNLLPIWLTRLTLSPESEENTGQLFVKLFSSAFCAHLCFADAPNIYFVVHKGPCDLTLCWYKFSYMFLFSISLYATCWLHFCEALSFFFFNFSFVKLYALMIDWHFTRSVSIYFMVCIHNNQKNCLVCISWIGSFDVSLSDRAQGN